MRKIKLILVSLFIILCCTGCNNSEVNRDLRHAGFNISSDEFSCEALIPKSDKEYEVIKYFGGDFAITTTGVIHELSFGQMFSNDQYCRKANTERKVVALYGNSVFKADDNKFYALKGTDKVAAYGEITPANDQNYAIYAFFFNDPAILKVQSSGNNIYYVLKTDGNFYQYNMVVSNGNIYLTSADVLYTAETYGSKIIDFNHEGLASTRTYIKTEDSFYRVSMVNKEKCTKYVDVQCEYDFGKDKDLSRHYKRIIAFDGGTIITDYLKIFRLG